MTLRSLTYAATLAFTVTGFTAAAYAAPITFRLSGVASGEIGGTAFEDKLVTLTATGDTSDVETVFAGPYVAMALDTTIVTIDGIATATILDPTEIFSSVVPVVLDTGYPSLPYVVIGRVDHPPALDSFTGIGAVGSDALLGYYLTTSIGPITDLGGIGFPVPCGVPGSDPCLSTTLGTLSFTSNALTAEGGTFSATVPEPASLLLLGTGLGVIGLALRGQRT